MNKEQRFGVEISTRYIKGKDENRFLKVRDKTIASYRMAIRSFMKAVDKLAIEPPPYLPKLYIIPFVFHLVSMEARKHTFKINLLTKDPVEQRKMAIFPSLPFLEKAPMEFATASFAHELVHFLSFGVGGVPRLAEGSNMLEADVELEKGIDNYSRCFEEPVKTWLTEWSNAKDEFLVNSFGDTKLCHTFRSERELDEYLYGST